MKLETSRVHWSSRICGGRNETTFQVNDSVTRERTGEEAKQVRISEQQKEKAIGMETKRNEKEQGQRKSKDTNSVGSIGSSLRCSTTTITNTCLLGVAESAICL